MDPAVTDIDKAVEVVAVQVVARAIARAQGFNYETAFPGPKSTARLSAEAAVKAAAPVLLAERDATIAGLEAALDRRREIILQQGGTIASLRAELDALRPPCASRPGGGCSTQETYHTHAPGCRWHDATVTAGAGTDTTECDDPDCDPNDCDGDHEPLRCPTTGYVRRNVATVNGRWVCCDGQWPDHASASSAGTDATGGERPYYCPTSGETESPTHGGFDVCCDAPELHTTATTENGGA